MMPGRLLLGLLLAAGAVANDDWEEAQTPQAFYDKAAASLSEEVRTLGGQVLLVWLIDASPSMKDDQEELRRRIRDLYARIDPDKVRLRMAVVGFNQEVSELQPPTPRAEEVMEALAKVPPDATGIEHCMAALLFAASRYAKVPDKKVFVLVTDERGDDETRVEEALAALRKAKARCFCIGREAPFHAAMAQEISGDPRLGTIAVQSGPEAPELELIAKDASFLSGIPSGFGNWAQERLCRETGGRYYRFRSGSMRNAKVDYDQDLLELDYAPDLCSRAEYGKLAQKTTLLKACRGAIQACDKAPTRRGTYAPASLAQELKADLEAVRQRLGVYEAQLKTLERALKEGAAAPRRVQANAELVIAQMRRERFQIQVQEESLEAVLAKPLPAMREGDRAYLDAILKDSQPHSAKAEALRAEADQAFQDLAAHHPRTPWAQAATALARMLPGLLILHIYTPQSQERPRW
jgi:hypothetical protein